MAKHILLYGNDSLLLRLRALVLEHSGFHVTNVSSYKVLTEQLASSQVDLLVFCHTLSPAERQSASVLGDLLRPDARIITLTSGHSVATNGVAELLNIFDGPQALVDRSRQLTM